MTPHEFTRKWRNVELKERTASQSHFNDLCALLGVLDPIAADPQGEWFTFERGATKTGGGEGWADVWRRGCFAWEYKGPRKDLTQAFSQLLQYSVALENPPLLIVSDMDRIRIHTNWTNTVQEVHDYTIDDLIDGEVRAKLKAAFTDPEAFKPAKTRAALTEETAREFAGLAERLRLRGHEAHDVAHFVNRLAFCMFAEDAGLLPDALFTKMLEVSRRRPDEFVDNARTLFRAMAHKGGKVGFELIEWFNGGLFEDDRVLPVTDKDIEELLTAARRDWSAIDPAILGTLFERGLDPDKRSQLGAHYTDRAKIDLIVRPVVVEPLEEAWRAAFAGAEAAIGAAEARAAAALEAAADRGELDDEVKALRRTLTGGRQLVLFEGMALQKRVRALDSVRADLREASRQVEDARRAARDARDSFLERLRAFRVLDPACGSGNFLYVALLALKDLEHRVNIDAETLGVPRVAPAVGPENVLGIEINPYAAELARVSVWIGEIQWMRRNGFDAARNPILRPLETIECRDAVLNSDSYGSGHPHPSAAAPLPPSPDGRGKGPAAEGGGKGEGDPTSTARRAEWPLADVIIGNPPFIGGKRMRDALGGDYVDALFAAYAGRVPQEADFVTYWVAKAWAAVASGRAVRVGLVTTNSVRGGANRRVLAPIADAGGFFAAWSDQPWTVDGAAVRVSLLAFSREAASAPVLDGEPVARINADLTGAASDLTKAVRLRRNAGVAFMGDTKGGAFDVPGALARQWLAMPLNPNGRPNCDVLRPWVNGSDVTRRPSDTWIIDFGWTMSESEAALYEAPFRHALLFVQPVRATNNRQTYKRFWWRHVEARQGLWHRLKGSPRYIVTPRVAKHRVFAWLPTAVVPDSATIAIARDDDTTFGILHSRFHELWSLRMGTFLGVGNDPRYTPSTTFETFPFPEGLTPDIAAADYADLPAARAIAAAASRLNDLREAWLNPADLVVREPEVVAGYPDRVLPRDADAVKALKARTLTALYNARPQWLTDAHAALDAAVADAYGWGEDWRCGALGDDELLARLFRLNQARG